MRGEFVAAFSSVALLVLTTASPALPGNLDAPPRSGRTGTASLGASARTNPRPGSSRQEAAQFAASQKTSPLDRLKSRSAEERLRELDIAMQPVQDAANAPQRASTAESAAPLIIPDAAPEPAAAGPEEIPALPPDEEFAPQADESPDTQAAEEELEDEAPANPPAAGKQPEAVVPPPVAPEQPLVGPYAEPTRDPTKLKKLSEILPYDDYEPDPTVRTQHRCQNLCPRPGDCPECIQEDGVNGRNSCPECPEEVRLTSLFYSGRNFPETGINWEPSNLYYNPLYTEDVPLERYGHTRGKLIQPFFSVPKFGLQVVGMPYQMVLSPPASCVYPLGYYRPGDCVPYMYYQIPLNLQAAAVQAGVVAGAYFLFVPNLNPVP